MDEGKDFPLLEIFETADKAVKDGGFVLQKWTCEKCGTRKMSDRLNQMAPRCRCMDCGHITDLTVKGCNYSLFKPLNRRVTVAEMEEALGLRDPKLH